MIKKAKDQKELTSEFTQDDFGYIYLIEDSKLFIYGYLNPCI